MKKVRLAIVMAVGLCVFLLTPHCSFAKESNEITPNEFMDYAEEIGKIYEIDPYLLLAICEKESSMRIDAENGDCKGLMQVSEKWHKERMEKLDVDDLFDPYGNILVASDFLAELFEENGDVYYVLMRYNMKISTANELYKNGKISNYAKSIVKRAEELRLADEKYRLIDEKTPLAFSEEQLLYTEEKPLFDELLPYGGASELLK